MTVHLKISHNFVPVLALGVSRKIQGFMRMRCIECMLTVSAQQEAGTKATAALMRPAVDKQFLFRNAPAKGYVTADYFTDLPKGRLRIST